MTTGMPQAPQEVNFELAHFEKWAISITFFIFCIFLSFSKGALAADAGGTLSIQVSGFAHQRGHAIANLFREGDEVLNLKNVYRRAQVEIRDGKATFSFPDLAYGTYAVSVYHDENDNGMLDHNVFHFPAEPLGFSNHFQLGLTSGMPTFEKMKFQFAADTGILEIVVK